MSKFRPMRTILCAFLVASASSVNGAVTIITGQIGPLRDSAGVTIPVGSLGFLVADQGGNGLVNAGSTFLSVGSFLGGTSDDLILASFTAFDLSGEGDVGFDFSGTVFNVVAGSSTSATTAGDPLYFVWFPTLTSASLNTSVAGNVSYGAFTSSIRDESADTGWVVPADGQIVSIISMSSSLGGNPGLTNAQATASFVTTPIPEPSTAVALAGAAILGFAAVRRRRHAI